MIDRAPLLFALQSTRELGEKGGGRLGRTDGAVLHHDQS